MRKESLLYLPILRSVQSTSDEKEAPNTDGTALAVSHTKIRRRKVMREHEMKVLNLSPQYYIALQQQHYSSSSSNSCLHATVFNRGRYGRNNNNNKKDPRKKNERTKFCLPWQVSSSSYIE